MKRRTKVNRSSAATGTRFYYSRAFQQSLSIRIAVTLALALTLIFAGFGLWVTTQLRSDLFTVRKDAVLSDASVRFSQAQNILDQSTAITPDQVQENVTQALNAVSDSAAGAGAVEVMLFRSPDAEGDFRINEYVNPDFVDIVTPQIRGVLTQENGTWQSIAIPSEDGEDPGILVGALVDVPFAGSYELYVVYSLGPEQATVNTVMRVLVTGVIPILIGMGLVSFVLVYRLLRPVRAAANAAAALAEGDLESRVEVQGIDEMARLGAAFNEMARSLQEKITDYDTLSKLQQSFVSDVSHELRTPMTTIRMADEMIYDDRDSLPPAAKRSAELLHSEVARFEQMLADLLEISRYDAQSAKLEGESTDLYSLVEKVIAANRELIDRLGVEVILGERPPKCSVPIDARRIERVIRNLIVNACEYAEGKPVEVTVAAGESAVAVRVRDTGVGMTPETARRVFDRFYRANPSRARTTGGTGLGLSIAKEDVTLHNGVINAWGEPGKGSSFVVTLPREAGSAVSEFPLVVWEVK